MAIEEAVAVVRDLIAEGDSAFAERHGEEGLSSAQAMRSLLEDRLRGGLAGRLSRGALWRDFAAEPEENAASVVGALEALVEADTSLAQEIEVLFSEYEIAVGPPTADAAPSRVEVGESGALSMQTVEEVPAVDREADRGTGEYMYGNVQSSSVSLEDEEPLDHVPPDRVTELNELDTEGTVPGPALNDFFAVVEAYPDLAPEERAQIEHDVEAVLRELDEQSAADRQALTVHLRRIGKTAPDVLDAMLERMEADRARLGIPASMAAREMRAWLEGREAG
jgi:hypothetical protein